jgi:hypothetical protein
MGLALKPAVSLNTAAVILSEAQARMAIQRARRA